MKNYIFIDESGNPDFYGSRKKPLFEEDNFNPIFLIGLIKTENRKKLRKSVLDFQNEILADPLYNSICTISKPGWYLHAKDDPPDVRSKFFEFLRGIDGFKTFIVIGRKVISRFIHKLNNNPTEFYFDLLFHLLKDRLNQEDVNHQLYLANRKSTTQNRFVKAIEDAITRDNARRKNLKEIDYSCQVVKSSIYPELSIVDYLLWALQRYIRSGEARYYKSIENKYNLIIDLYDIAHFKSNYYNSKNRFSIEKASRFDVK